MMFNVGDVSQELHERYYSSLAVNKGSLASLELLG